MARVDTFRLSFSVLDDQEPRRWSIWKMPFPDLDQMVRGTQVKVEPYTTLNEFFLLDETIEQLDERDSWTNVIGTVIHMTSKERLEHLLQVHRRHCQYIKRAPDALCYRFGYYVLPVVDGDGAKKSPKGPAPVDPQQLLNYSSTFVKDAKLALGRHVAEGPLTASSADGLRRRIVDIAQRIIMHHEQEQDR